MIREVALFTSVLLASLAPAWAAEISVILQQNHTVTTGRLTISIPQTWIEAGHVYTVTVAPVSGQTSSYGDPYLQSIVYQYGSTTRRIVYESRHTPELGERAYLNKGMWNPGDNRAEFWVKCEVASCYMRVTVYERAVGTFDNKTFYREGVEPGVLDGQFSLNQDFYHTTRKNGVYGLQVPFQAGRYMYLYRNDNMATNGVNALSLWLRSSSSVNEDDLSIALTTGDHYMLTDWLPMSDYVTISQPDTWYKAVIPLEDLNPSGGSIRGVAIKSDSWGYVYFDDVELLNANLTSPLKLPLPAGNEWYLTTEAGGHTDCINSGDDTFHYPNAAYYSIDFAPRTLSSGNGSAPLTDVPILAAGDGKVIEAPSSPHAFNGYYVRIDHDEPYDGSGLTSYYLHLRSSASSLLGTIVPQGKILGFMGTTGESTATHLHFQLKYNGDSTISASNLANTRVDGLLMTDYDAGCRLNVPPTGFYPSTNVPKP